MISFQGYFVDTGAIKLVSSKSAIILKGIDK